MPENGHVDGATRPPNDRTDLWLGLLRRLTEEVPEWSTWKNVDSALAGTGDVDSLAPKDAWPRIREIFIDWATERGFGPVVVCHHVAQGPHFITFEPGAPYILQLDVKILATFRGSTLVNTSIVRPLTAVDQRGVRGVRAGADGVIRLLSNGVLPGGREDRAALVKKRVPQLLASDPEGVELMAATFGPVRNAVLAGARAVVNGEWDRRAMRKVEAWALARSLAEPGVAASRIWFAKVEKRRCPVIRLIRDSNRRVPPDLPAWVDTVRSSHEVIATNGTGA